MGLAMKLGKLVRSKQRFQDSTSVHNLLLCAHIVVVVPRSVVNNYYVLCRVKVKNREQEHTTKDFAEFYHHSPLLTMAKNTSCFAWLAKFDLSGGLYFVKLVDS